MLCEVIYSCTLPTLHFSSVVFRDKVNFDENEAKLGHLRETKVENKQWCVFVAYLY